MKCVAAFCVLLLCLNSLGVTEETQTWTVTGLRAPVYAPEHVRLRISAERLTFLDKHQHALLEIPLAQVVTVMYTPVSFSRGAAVLNGMPTGCVGDQRGCGGTVLLFLAVALILSPSHGRSHYIRITWADRGVEQQLEFEIGKNDYQPLLDAVKNFSGVKYVDLEAEGQRVQKELAQNIDKSMPLHLDRGSRVGVYDLASGDYQLVSLTRPDNRIDVYVFAPPTGQAPAPSNLKAVARARLDTTSSPDSVEFKNGIQVASISVSGQMLTFTE